VGVSVLVRLVLGGRVPDERRSDVRSLGWRTLRVGTVDDVRRVGVSNELGARASGLVESDVGRAVPERAATRSVLVVCREEEAQLETHLLSYR
jgi:hypothetical protein